MNFSLIAAMDKNRGIGKNNALAWHLSADLKHFSQVTQGGTVLMGRKTWESLPEKYRPLPGRLNIVVSRGDLELPEGTLLAHSLDEALTLAEKNTPTRPAFVIGGATLYAEAIEHPACTQLLLTEIEGTFDCDAFFPEISHEWQAAEQSELQQENDLKFRFKTYKK